MLFRIPGMMRALEITAGASVLYLGAAILVIAVVDRWLK